MAHGAVLTRLLGVWLQVALIASSSSGISELFQAARNADLAEDSNDAEFRPNSMGISKVIDLNTGTIAYKDHILKSCFIEKISTSSPWEKDRMLIIYPRLLTNEQIAIISGKIVSNFCFGWPSRILRSPNHFNVRRKRSNNQYYFVGRKARGQTQSQYLQFGNGDSPGRAEAEATRLGSKATVFGSRGMGQAQSQSDPFSCTDCYSFGGTGVSGSQQIDTFGPRAAGRQLEPSGQSVISGTSTQTDAFGRPISTGNGSRQRPISETQQPGSYLPSQLGPTPDGRVMQPETIGQTDGRLPGTSSIHIPAGQIGGIHEKPGTITYLPSGQAGGAGDETNLLYPGGQAPGQIGRHGPIVGSLQTYPGQTGGESSTFLTPGHKPIETIFVPESEPGSQQRYPSRAGDTQTTLGGPSSGDSYIPSQIHPGPQNGVQRPTESTFMPGQRPESFQIYPGQNGRTQVTVGRQGAEDTYIPGQKPGSLQIRPDQAGGTQQLYPGQIETGHVPGRILITPSGPQQIRPASQIYDQDGLQKPSGRPVHPADVSTVPVGQVPYGSISTQPGKTTYFIPGGIRPRPGDGTFGYYPSTHPPTGRIPPSTGTQDGNFQGEVAGQYRPASGPGGDFSGTFQGTYLSHGDKTQQAYPGTNSAQIDQSGRTIGQSPQGPQITGQTRPTGQGTYVPGQPQISPSGQTWIRQPEPGFQPGTQISDQTIYRPGTGPISGTSQGQEQISTNAQYPGGITGPPQQGVGMQIPGQTITSGQYPIEPGRYPIGSTSQTEYKPDGRVTPEHSIIQYPGQTGTLTSTQYPSTGFLPGQQPNGARYPSQPGYQQEISSGPQYPGTSILPLPGLEQIDAGRQQPGQPISQQGTLIDSQYTGTGPRFVSGQQPSQPGYQQGLPTEHQYSGTGQQQSATGERYPVQPGYQQGLSIGPQYTGFAPGQQPGGAAPGQIQLGYQQKPGQTVGTPGATDQYGQTITGRQEGAESPGAPQISQYLIPGSGQVGQAQFGQEQTGDDSHTQAQSSIQRADNETQASASSSGRFQAGTAQSQVSGSYAGTGSFSASAGTNDGLRGAQTQVSGNSEGTLSSSQGTGGRAKSQAQVQLSADTGDTQSSAQTGGLNHGTNTQVQSGIKGGMADAQANGPGSTSSQAQIGFVPYDATNNDDDAESPHNGGGTASASSGTHAGKSQVQINGKYAFGIRYTGQAQASSANAGYTAENINLPTMKPIDFSHTPHIKPAKQEKINVRQIDDSDDPSLIKIITSSTTPNPDEEEDDYDYDDPDPPPSQQNLLQQARTRSLMHDALDPLEDIEDHGVPIQGQLKHGDIIETGQYIPGSPGYKIPEGFRGRVTDDSDHFTLNKRIIYAAGANANRRGYHEGYGSGYFYQPRYSPIQYGFKSSAHPKNFVSMTKSETGSRNIATGKKTPSSTYYTQSSTCGYFTNTCVYSNGRKICLPKPKANPDGTPIICRN